MTNRQLVSQFLETRSEQAFISLYDQFTPRLYQVAYRLSGHDKTTADDLIQQMWYIVVQKLEKFEWKSELSTWLTGILINIWREKRRKSQHEILIHLEIQDEDHSDEDEEESLFNMDHLELAIAKLPPGYRQIIILHDVEGYTHSEIAHIVGITEGTSKSQLYQARKALRTYLKEAIKVDSYE